MGFILWLVMGLIVGGWLSSIFLGVDLTTGFNLTTMVTSIIVGAVIVIGITRLIFRGRSPI